MNRLKEYEKQGITESECKKIHLWIRKNYGYAHRCVGENCKGISKNFEWALIHGKLYARDVNNFRMLCVSCHRSYDKLPDTEEIRIKKSVNNANKGLYGANHPRSVPYSISRDGVNIRFETLTDCANFLGLDKRNLATSFKKCGKYKQYKIEKLWNTTKKD